MNQEAQFSFGIECDIQIHIQNLLQHIDMTQFVLSKNVPVIRIPGACVILASKFSVTDKTGGRVKRAQSKAKAGKLTMLKQQQSYDGQSWASMGKYLVVGACTRRH